MAAPEPTADTKSPPTSLAKRAPTGPIATRTWEFYLNVGPGRLDYANTLEQRTGCLRSRVAHVSRGFKLGQNVGGMPLAVSGEVAHTLTSFPYPTVFRKILETQPQRQTQARHDDIEGQGTDAGGSIPPPGQSNTTQGNDPQTPATAAVDITYQSTQEEQSEWQVGVTSSCFGLSRKSVINFETHAQPMYVVLGIFPRGYSSPHERIVFVHEPEHLFRQLRWAAFRLRGLSSALFSLRHVKGFRLYKCHVQTGTHERVDLDQNGIADLQLLLQNYNSWHVPSYISKAWANWIYYSLNNESHDVLHGMYSLELVLDWSVTRISVVVLLPVLLSLAIGLWLNSAAWSDLATIQTAWGTASYVVTAGGLVAALLGILSSLGNK